MIGKEEVFNTSLSPLSLSDLSYLNWVLTLSLMKTSYQGLGLKFPQTGKFLEFSRNLTETQSFTNPCSLLQSINLTLTICEQKVLKFDWLVGQHLSGILSSLQLLMRRFYPLQLGFWSSPTRNTIYTYTYMNYRWKWGSSEQVICYIDLLKSTNL